MNLKCIKIALLLTIVMLFQLFGLVGVNAETVNYPFASGDSVYAKGTAKTTGQGFNTFNDAKKALDSAGEGNQWYHIVEQSQINKSGFNPTQIQNTNNLIAVDKAAHAKISGYYSSKQAFTEGKTVRDWLAGQSYDKQFEFGMQKLKDFGVIK